MDEHRDIYTTPDQKPAGPANLPAYEPTPEEVRRRVRKRIIISTVIMLVLVTGAAVYFYSQESGFERNPLMALLTSPGRATGTTARATATNVLPGLPEFDLEAAARGGPAIPPQKMAEAMGHLRIANQYLSEHDLDAAEENARKALGVWPDMNAALRMLGVIYIHRGQFDQAILILERALQNDPFSAETLINMSTAYMQKGQLEKAEDLLLTSLQINANNFTTQSNLGLLYLLWARYDQAADHLEQALQLMPDNASVRNNLGVCLLRLGRFDQARAEFQRLAEQTPDRAQPFFNNAIAFALEQKYTEALDWIIQAVHKCSPQEAQRSLMDSDFDGMRGMPEFQAIMRTLSEPAANQPAPPPAP